MSWESYELTFLTPCFCAGAHSSRAEIRAPSIRGELRWWFRVLGGNRDLENEVFGAVHGRVTASALMVRVAEDKRSMDAPRLPKNQNFFLRKRTDGCLPQGSRATLRLRLRKALSSSAEDAWCRCLEVFFQLGAIGARSTRGCGAFAVENQVMDRDSFLRWARNLPGLDVYAWPPVKTAAGAHAILEEKLGEFRSEAGLSKEDPDALGHAQGSERHNSCLRLRPVQVSEGILPVMLYTDQAKADNIRSIQSDLRNWCAHMT